MAATWESAPWCSKNAVKHSAYSHLKSCPSCNLLNPANDISISPAGTNTTTTNSGQVLIEILDTPPSRRSILQAPSQKPEARSLAVAQRAASIQMTSSKKITPHAGAALVSSRTPTQLGTLAAQPKETQWLENIEITNLIVYYSLDDDGELSTVIRRLQKTSTDLFHDATFEDKKGEYGGSPIIDYLMASVISENKDILERLSNRRSVYLSSGEATTNKLPRQISDRNTFGKLTFRQFVEGFFTRKANAYQVAIVAEVDETQRDNEGLASAHGSLVFRSPKVLKTPVKTEKGKAPVAADSSSKSISPIKYEKPSPIVKKELKTPQGLASQVRRKRGRSTVTPTGNENSKRTQIPISISDSDETNVDTDDDSAKDGNRSASGERVEIIAPKRRGRPKGSSKKNNASIQNNSISNPRITRTGRAARQTIGGH